MQIYFHSRHCSYLPRVPILVEGTVYIYNKHYNEYTEKNYNCLNIFQISCIHGRKKDFYISGTDIKYTCKQ